MGSIFEIISKNEVKTWWQRRTPTARARGTISLRPFLLLPRVQNEAKTKKPPKPKALDTSATNSNKSGVPHRTAPFCSEPTSEFA